MHDTQWDVEKYKTEHESDEHWDLRKKFMLAHQNTLPEDEVVCMAQVFTNIEFLGCRYPDETMIKVASLAKGVVEEFREKKKNTLKRTFVAASDAASSKVKGLHRRSDASDHSTPAKKKQNISFLPSSGTSDTSFQNCHTESSTQNFNKKRFRDLPGPFGKYIFPHMAGKIHSDNNIISSFASRNKAEYKCDLVPLPTGQVKCNVSIDGNMLCEAVAMSGKEAKALAVATALAKLREQCYTLVIKSTTVGQSVSQTDFDATTPIVAEMQTESNNIGGKLMKMMGWTGGGLGKDAQGIVEPIQASTTVRRLGLGVSASTTGRQFEMAVRNYIREWINTGAQRDLVFSSDFSKEDRKLVHQASRKFGVTSKSHGKGEDRQLVLSRKQSLMDIARQLFEEGGENEKYTLLEPGEPLPD